MRSWLCEIESVADTLPKTSILLWVPRFWPAMGGTELHTHTLAQRLAAQHRVRVLTHCDTTESVGRPLSLDALATTDDQYVAEQIEVSRLGLSSMNSPWSRQLANAHARSKFARRLFSTLYSRNVRQRVAPLLAQADLVHFIYNGLTEAATYASECAQRQGVPFVLTPNVLDTSDQRSAWNSRRFKQVYQRADALIALTAHEAEYLCRQGVHASKIDVIPYGPLIEPNGDARRARRLLDLKDERVILFLGRIVEYKGYKLLLEALATVRRQVPDVVAVFMGPADPEVARELTALREHRVIHFFDQDQAIKADMLALCDVLCVPSSAESLGVVYLEAFAYQKPVVALDLPVLREVIDPGVDGFLVSPDAESVARACVRILDHAELAARMGANGYEKVVSRYAWESVEQAVATVYRRFVSRARVSS